ncbi:MAG: hypothetical protein AAF727_06525 [Pseudomonadota bacterium]
MLRATTLSLFFVLAGCAQFPELDGTVAPDLANADFPDLVPLGPLLQDVPPDVDDAEETTRALDARIAALRARAAALQRREIVAPEDQSLPSAASN